MGFSELVVLNLSLRNLYLYYNLQCIDQGMVLEGWVGVCVSVDCYSGSEGSYGLSDLSSDIEGPTSPRV